MTLNSMIEQLDELRELYGNIDIRIAQQPSWPLEYRIQDNIVAVDISDCTSDDDDEKTMVIYLVEGSQIGYLPRAASNEIGWR